MKMKLRKKSWKYWTFYVYHMSLRKIQHCMASNVLGWIHSFLPCLIMLINLIKNGLQRIWVQDTGEMCDKMKRWIQRNSSYLTERTLFWEKFVFLKNILDKINSSKKLQKRPYQFAAVRKGRFFNFFDELILSSMFL